MRRIRVVFSIGAMHGGGSERQLLSLLRHLDREIFEPFLYLVYKSGPLLDQIPTDVPVTSFDTRVTSSRIYLPGLMHSRRVRDYARFLKEVDADVSYDRTFLMTLISAAGAKKASVPNVSTIVTDPETGFAPVAGRFQWWKRRILHRLYNQSAQVLAVSDGAREAAIRFYGIEPDRIATLRNGVDIDWVQRQSSQPIDNAWWTGDRRSEDAAKVVRIVSAGRLNQQKGFYLLIDALAQVRQKIHDVEFRLAILGDGPHREPLEQQISAMNLIDVVHLPGFQENAISWYRSADIFVLPSLVEGMPNVLLEAMACGTPVISSDCHSGPAEILDSGRFGRLVPPGSVDALREALVDAIHDTSRFREMASNAESHVAAEWSARAATVRLEEVLKRCARHD
ncbi:MAG TPA: glycosyltransferase [Planctomycetaceae bacterium]|nr:glycosyltransferase [Planctomycetaceae bacterium]